MCICMRIYESHLLYILAWAGLRKVMFLILFMSFDFKYEGKDNVFLLFMISKTILAEKGNVFLLFILFKTNFEGKGNVFLAFYTFKESLDQASNPYRPSAFPGPSNFASGSIKSKKGITFSLKVGLGKHRSKKPKPKSSKLILKSTKSNTSITFSLKVGLEKHKQEKHYFFPQGWS